jgi:GINS complex subunit 1
MDPIGLVREVGRFSSSLNVEPYNDNHVRAGVGQINRLFAEAAIASKLHEATAYGLDTFRSTIDPDDFKFLLMQNEIMRIKRCLLTYHKARLDHLARMSKELPTFPANVRSQLSKSENVFQTEYAASLGKMAQSYGNIVNLSGPLNPPKDLYVTVRVLKDCGTIQTEFGPLYLNANTFHFVRKADVEHLITQGFLAHVK